MRLEVGSGPRPCPAAGRSRPLLRRAATSCARQLLWGLLLLVLWGCGREHNALEPVAVKVHFLGKVKLYQPPGGSPEARYERGDGLTLLLEPGSPALHQCSPFAGGSLDLEIFQPDRRSALTLTLPLPSPGFQRVSSGYLLSSIPARPVTTGETKAPVFAPDMAGRWQLVLTWRCQGSTRTLRSTHPFWCHLRPEDRPEGILFRDITPRPLPEQITAYRGALEEELEPETRLWVLKRLQKALEKAGQLEPAREAALRWAEAAQRAGFPSEAVLAWNAAYEAAMKVEQFEEALRALDRSVALSEALDYRVRMPVQWYSRAVLAWRLGSPLQALEALSHAKEEAERTGQHDWLEAAGSLELQLLQGLGHYHVVNQRIEPVLSGGGWRDPTTVNMMGWLALKSVEAGVPAYGEAGKALERAERAFQFAAEKYAGEKDQARGAHPLANLAELAALRGRAVEARRWLTEARARGSSADQELSLFFLQVEGRLRLLEGAPGEAFGHFRTLEEEAGRAGRVEYAGTGAFGQGEVLRAQRRLREASTAYERALSWIEEDSAVRSPLHSASMLTSRALWEARAIQTRLELGQPIEALELVERGAWSRGQSLTRSALRTGLSKASLEAVEVLELKLQRIDQELRVLDGLTWNREMAAKRRQREEERQRLWEAQEMLIGGVVRTAPPPLTLGRMRAFIPDGGMLIRIAMLPEELIVWEVTARTFQVRRVALPRAELERRLRAFQAVCEKGGAAFAEADPLSRDLLGQVAGSPPAHLIVVADGELRGMPWPALPVREAPLITWSTLEHLPSLLIPRRQAPAFERAMLVAVDPLGDLRKAREEAGVLRELSPASHGGGTGGDGPAGGGRPLAVLERDAATGHAIRRGLPGATLFHFAGHVESDREMPYRSHLKLARHERFSLMEIRSLKLEHPLVFLNACGSGRVARDGGLGLADGFLAAGAGAVIASRWDLPDEAGPRVAGRFYRKLLQVPGADPARALSETLRELVAGAEGESLRSPRIWSSFLILNTFRTGTEGR